MWRNSLTLHYSINDNVDELLGKKNKDTFFIYCIGCFPQVDMKVDQ